MILLLVPTSLVFCSFLLVSKKIDLFDAINQGLVSVEAISNGLDRGDYQFVLFLDGVEHERATVTL